jgi:hypothetical protein
MNDRIFSQFRPFRPPPKFRVRKLALAYVVFALFCSALALGAVRALQGP